MNKALLTAFVLLICTFLRAQNLPFRVAPFFIVSMPAIPDSLQKKEVKMYMLNTDSIYYLVGFDNKKLKIKSRKDFEIGLKGFYDGFKPKLAGYAVQTNDTIIGGQKGQFAFAVSLDNSDNKHQVFLFFTIVDGHCCFVQCSTPLDAPAQRGVQSFFNSVRLKGENYPDNDESGIAFFVGQVLGYVIIATVFFLVVRFLIRLVTRKRS